MAGILAAPVGVVHQPRRWFPAEPHHGQRIRHDVRRYAGLQRPAHYFAVEQVKHDGQVQLYFARLRLAIAASPFVGHQLVAYNQLCCYDNSHEFRNHDDEVEEDMPNKNRAAILHITDLHIGCLDPNFDSYYQDLLTDIDVHLVNNQLELAAVIFTGDLAWSGQAGQFQGAQERLSELKVRLGQACANAKFFFSPGNHDLSRDCFSKMQLPAPSDLISLCVARKSEDKTINDLLRASCAAFYNFDKWEKANQSSLPIAAKSSVFAGTWAHSLKTSAGLIGIVSLNSAALHFSNVKPGHLAIPRWWLPELIPDYRDWKRKHLFSILITHHPLPWLTKESNLWIQEDLVHLCGVRMHLCGHEHIAETNAKSTDGNIALIQMCGHAMNASNYVDPKNCYHQREIGYAVYLIGSDDNGIEVRSLRRRGKVNSHGLMQFERDNNCSYAQRYDAFDNWSDAQIIELPESRRGAVHSAPSSRRMPSQGEEAASRLVRNYHQVHSAKFMNELLQGLVLDESGSPVESPFSTIIDSIKSKNPGDFVCLVAEHGAGRGPLLSLLFRLFRELSPDRSAEFVDLRYGTTRQELDALLDNQVLFVVDDPSSSRNNDVRRVLLSQPRALIVMCLDKTDEQVIPDCSYFLNQEEDTAEGWLRFVAFCDNTKLANPGTHADRLRRVCSAHGVAPGFYMARYILSTKVTSARQEPQSLAEYIQSSCVGLIQRHLDHLGSADTLDADKLFIAACEIEYRKRIGLASQGSNPTDACKRAHSILAIIHPCVGDSMVAHHELALIESLGSGAESEDVVKSDLQLLNVVFPNSINAFVRDLLVGPMSPERRQFIVQALLSRISVDKSGKGTRHLRLLRANFAYLLGRFKHCAGAVDALIELKKVCRKDIHELSVVLGLLRDNELSSDFQRYIIAILCKHFGSRNCLKAAQRRDPVSVAKRIISELRMVERSACISLAVLGNTGEAADYFKHLATNPAADRLNRGFHLDYYGDKKRRDGEHFISDDDESVPCRKAIAALTSGLAQSSCSAELKLIQCYTLGSLIRVRCAGPEPKVSSQERRKACDAIQAFIDSKPQLHSYITDTLASFLREITLGDWLVERYIDDLYDIKFQSRTGWDKSLAPEDNVAAHSFMALILSQILLPTDHNEYCATDKGDIVNALAFHDLAEAITSDIPSPAKTNQNKMDEFQVMYQIARIGLLTGSQEGACIGTRFSAFSGEAESSTMTSKLSNDIDRLELLIQALRYERAHGDFPRLAAFMESCKPNKFESKIVAEWAHRFINYFKSQTMGTGDLWSINKKLVSICDVPKCSRERIDANNLIVQE